MNVGHCGVSLVLVVPALLYCFRNTLGMQSFSIKKGTILAPKVGEDRTAKSREKDNIYNWMRLQPLGERGVQQSEKIPVTAWLAAVRPVISSRSRRKVDDGDST